MSRHGYIEGDDMEPGDYARWRAHVANAARGKRGQAMLRDLLEGLEAMPADKRELHAIVVDDGANACALGVVGRVRGVDLGDLNPELDEEGDFDEDDVDSDWLAGQMSQRLDVATQLAREVMWENDEHLCRTGNDRWQHMYAWAHRLYRGQLDPFAPARPWAFDGAWAAPPYGDHCGPRSYGVWGQEIETTVGPSCSFAGGGLGTDEAGDRP